MDDDYISREAAVRELEFRCKILTVRGGKTAADILTRYGIKTIRNRDGLPAADVRPVVRSEWEVVEKGLRYEIWKCKQCGDLLKVRKDTFNCGRGNCFFCPRCGAVMREDQNGTDD